MTFREFNLSLMRDPVLGSLLPLQLRRTYPRLSLEGETLCAAFAGFRIGQERGAVLAYPPAYYLRIAFPRRTLLAFERLAPAGDGRPMTPRTPEEVKALAELCDRVLALWEEGSEGLAEALSAYNALLDRVLEPEQLAVLDKFAGV